MTAVLAAGAVASTADAAPLASAPVVLGAPVPVGVGRGGRLVAGSDGSITAAWTVVERTGGFFDGPRSSSRSTIFVATRPPGVAVFTAAQRVAVIADDVAQPSAARGADGSLALAWSAEQRMPDGVRPPTIALAAPGGPMGAPRELPLPERLPARRADATEDTRYVGPPEVAVAADGAVVAIACERDGRASSAQALIWLKSPGEAQFQPARRSGRCSRTVRVAADARGGIVALWSGERDGVPDPAPRVVWVADRRAGGGFAERQAISDPVLDADNGLIEPQLRVAPTGDALAVWAGGENPGAALASVRPAGGTWGPPSRVTPAGDPGGAPEPAVNDRGDMAVVWDSRISTGGVFRPAGGAFGSSTASPHAQGGVVPEGVALDARGTAIVIRGQDDLDGLVAVLRSPDGAWSAPQRFTPEGVRAETATVVSDAYGNGLILWSTLHDGASTLAATAYSATPPGLGALRLTPTTLRLTPSEPARLSLTASAGRRTARQLRGAVAPGRAVTIRLNAALRRVLRGRDAQLLIRARDAGPRVTVKKLRLRR